MLSRSSSRLTIILMLRKAKPGNISLIPDFQSDLTEKQIYCDKRLKKDWGLVKNTTKETVIVENENFKFCSIFPSLVGSKHLVASFSDGLTSEELDKPFEKLYEENDNIYKMLSVCLYEKYDWPKALNPKLHSVLKSPSVELTLRCVCNYDLCNSPSTFSTYTNQLEN